MHITDLVRSMYITDLIVDKNMRSTLKYGSPKFPIQIYNHTPFQLDPGYLRWHWHPEIEFFLVEEGTLEMFIEDSQVILQKGEGVFINSEVLHMARAGGDKKTSVSAFAFVIDPRIFSLSSDCLLTEKYVDPIIFCQGLAYLYLDTTAPWYVSCCDHLRAILQLQYSREFGFEFAIRNHLCNLWYLFIIHTANIQRTTNQSHLSNVRIKKMMSYIYDNYDKQISLEDIALSANISKSECEREFQKNLKMRPIEYLTKYRINIAMYLLKKTDMTITAISSACGFNSSSYFGKQFYQITSCTPREYRKRKVNGYESLQEDEADAGAS